MRVSINSELLVSAATFVAKAIPARTPDPIYTGVLIQVTDDSVTLSGQNPHSQWFTTASVPAESVESAGTVLVSGRLLAEIASALPKGTVSIEDFDTRVHITAGAARFKVPVMPVAQYTKAGTTPVTILGTLPTAELARAVDRVARAADMSPNPDVPLLGNVRMEISKSSIVLAATDRYRLANATLAWKSEADAVNLVVPARQLAETVKALSKDGDTIQLSLNEQGLLTLNGQTRAATVGNFEGEYPSWRSLLPAANAITARATLDSAELTGIVNRVALVADGGPLTLQFADGRVTVTVGDDGAGGPAGADVMDAELSGAPITIGFRAAYLKDAIASCGSDQVTFAMTVPARPALVAPAGEEGYSHLVMPTRLAPAVAAAA